MYHFSLCCFLQWPAVRFAYSRTGDWERFSVLMLHAQLSAACALVGWESTPAHPSPGSGPPLLTQCGDGSRAEDCHPGTASLSGSSSVSCPSPAIACYWFLSFYWYGILVPGQFPLLPSPQASGFTSALWGWWLSCSFLSSLRLTYSFSAWEQHSGSLLRLCLFDRAACVPALPGIPSCPIYEHLLEAQGREPGNEHRSAMSEARLLQPLLASNSLLEL